MEEINVNRNMADLIGHCPELGQLLEEKGISCGDCLASQVDTLKDVARMYHLNLEELLAQLRLRRSR